MIFILVPKVYILLTAALITGRSNHIRLIILLPMNIIVVYHKCPILSLDVSNEAITLILVSLDVGQYIMHVESDAE